MSPEPLFEMHLVLGYVAWLLYVPLLMITHLVAFYFLARPSGRQAAA
jgi:hypothetical protein